MLGHGVVDEGEVLVADHPPGVGDLGDVTRPVAAVRAAAVPDLVVEHGDAAGRPEVVVYTILPLGPVQRIRTGAAEEVGARDDLRASVFGFGNIGQVVVAGEEQHREAHVRRRLAFGQQEMGRVVLVPPEESARTGHEGVVVDDVAVLGHQRLGETHDRLQVEEPQVRLAELEHAVAQRHVRADRIQAVRVVAQAALEVFAQHSAPVGRQDVLQEQESLAVERIDPFTDPRPVRDPAAQADRVGSHAGSVT